MYPLPFFFKACSSWSSLLQGPISKHLQGTHHPSISSCCDLLATIGSDVMGELKVCTHTSIHTYVCAAHSYVYVIFYSMYVSLCSSCTYSMDTHTVESLLKDTPNKGHHRKYLSTKDTFGGTKNGPSCSSNTIFISEEWTTSLQGTN